MHPIKVMGDDGGSAPGLYSGMTPSVPHLVVWPMLTPVGSLTAEAIEQIYRLAHEWAQAALRPAAYEVAQRVYCN